MWSPAQFADLVHELGRWGLVFDVELPTHGPVWRELYRQVMLQLHRVDIVIPDWDFGTPCPDSPHRLPFVLLSTRSTRPRKPHDPYDDLTATTFTLATMREKPRGLISVEYPFADRPRTQSCFRIGELHFERLTPRLTPVL